MSGQGIAQRVSIGWKHLSITNKLFISALGIIVTSFIVSAVIITKISSDSLRQAINSSMTSEAQKTALQIDEQLKEGIGAVNNMSDNPTLISLMQRSKSKAQTKTLSEYRLAVQTFKHIAADNANFISVYVGIDQSDYIIDEGEWVSPPDYVMKDRDWYKGTVNTEGIFISQVYKDAETGKLVVTISKAIRDNGKLLGAVGVDYSFDGINQILKRLKLGKLGYAMLIDQDGLILYHPQQKKVLQENLNKSAEEEVRSIAGKMVHGEEGTGYFHDENAAHYLSYAPIPLSHWSVGVAIPADDYERPMRTTNAACAVVYLVCLIIIGLAIRYVSKSILRSIPRLLLAMQQAASGDLTTQVEIDSDDEIGRIASGFNTMIIQQKDAMAKVLDLSRTVARASSEIDAGNEELSRRTQEQASTLEEVAATVEEMTASIQQTAHNSSEAVTISNRTLETVHAGESAVTETAEAMGRITESSKAIQEIMRVIKDITFQTNLLALNAAVEAARAGEQGRGFAVVAAEVRNLAGRTADSSKEIETLIRESVSRVERGNELIQRSKAVLEEVVRNTQKTAEVVMEITTTMKEQSTASGQIQSAIEEINQATQQNAAMVEEIAASSVSLNHETAELAETVSNFKIEERTL